MSCGGGIFFLGGGRVSWLSRGEQKGGLDMIIQGRDEKTDTYV